MSSSADRVLAWRYTRALFAVAAQSGEEGRVLADLQATHGGIIDRLPLLRHPRVSTAEKKRRVEEALSGRACQLTLEFLKLLIQKKRFDLLPMVAANLGRLIAEKNNLVKAEVRAARPLSTPDQEALGARLKKFAGKNVELEIKEDPELIGGLVVRLGDWVLDSSLRGQLRKLREAIYVH